MTVEELPRFLEVDTATVLEWAQGQETLASLPLRVYGVFVNPT